VSLISSVYAKYFKYLALLFKIKARISKPLLYYNYFALFKLIFRRVFCSYNAFEIDELLRTNPSYRRPERAPLSHQRTESMLYPSTSTNLLNISRSPLVSPLTSTSQNTFFDLLKSKNNPPNTIASDRSLLESQAINSNEYTISHPII
jgi:hypothetical protein